MRVFPPCVYAAMMPSGFSFCRLAAFVCQHQCDELDERAGSELRQDFRIIYVPSDFRWHRFGRLERPVELGPAIVVGAGMCVCTSCDSRTILGEHCRDLSAARGDTSVRRRRVGTAL